ncbi:MAG: hypothetical protein ACKVQR_20465 [Aquabacterium sp.]
MRTPQLVPTTGPDTDPVILIEHEEQVGMTLVRLVLCAALAVAILALASRLLG